MGSRRISCGWQMNCIRDISSALNLMQMSGYSFLVGPVVHPRCKREFIKGKAKDREGPFTRSDLLLPSHEWNSLLVGKLSWWIDADSDDPSVRTNSESALQQELQYCTHLGLPAVLFILRGASCVNAARILHNKTIGIGHLQIWVQVPMKARSDQLKWFEDEEAFERMDINGDIDTDGSTCNEDTWKWWNRLHSLCNWEKKICLALELTADLPSSAELDRWLAEPIKCIIVPTHLFLSNKKGFPVLSRQHQHVLQQLFTLDVQVVISGHRRHQHMKYYHQYMDHIWQSNQADDPLKEFARGYEDYLQCPLQPLMDNLESQTYETFEKDPVKYSQYQKAIFNALLDRNKNEKTVVMVVGAGRGPLVRATLTSAQLAQRRVKVYAVEKNPNAVVTLQALKDEQWGDDVTVVFSDMRKWEAPEKADILISELLGSFGDNELSPECLDGAQIFLKEGGISIPSKYTSYVAPLQSGKLYNDVRNCRDKDKHHLHQFETAYVVHLHNKMLLDSPQPLFTFHHPNWDVDKDNRRSGKATFTSKMDSVIHGFGGYFDAILYKDVTLSIHPDTHSPGMCSWFPILFPIKDPIPVSEGEKVEINFWRLNNSRIVWYEWCLTFPRATPIHNPNGRAYSIGL